METRFIFFKGRYAKIEDGKLKATNEEEVSSYLRVHQDGTILFFKEGNEPEPTFFRQSSARIRIVGLRHGDPDVLTPLLGRELKDVTSEQLLNWMKINA